MSLKTLFFSFDGRIGRRQWWLATLAVVLASLAATYLANPIRWHMDSEPFTPSTTGETLFTLAFLIPETAVSVKRFHDRGWPNWVPYSYAIAIVVVTLLDHFRLIFAHPDPTTGDLWIIAGVMAMLGFIVIDNGMLRGTRGPNRYGPDPLARRPDPSQSAATAAAPTQSFSTARGERP